MMTAHNTSSYFDHILQEPGSSLAPGLPDQAQILSECVVGNIEQRSFVPFLNRDRNCLGYAVYQNVQEIKLVLLYFKHIVKSI